MSHTILCIQPGSGPFLVGVDMAMTVFQLKQIIKAIRAPALDAIPADALELYKINVDISSDDNYARMKHDIANGVYKFNEQGELNPSQKVSKYLQQDLEDVIQVLVKPPPGEPIDLFAGAVAESRSASTAHCIMHKHQQGHDGSLRILKRWAISVDARTEFDIRRTLNTPLTKEEKIPITQQEYDDLLRMNLSNQEELLTTENLDTLFRVSNEDSASMLYKHIWVRIINNNPHAYGTESSFHSFWDDQIGRTLRLILNGTFIRDSNRETSAGLLRPDYGFLLRGHCLFRGEEKPPGTREPPLLVEELKNKIVEWTYGPLDYILGYTAVGTKIKLVMITDEPRYANVLAAHDLRVAGQRIECLINLVRLSAVLTGMSKRLGKRDVPEFQTIERPDGLIRIDFGGGCVKKTFMHPNAADHVNHLSRIYSRLREKDVPYTDSLQGAYKGSGEAYITTVPIGLTQWPNDGRDAHRALICVLTSLTAMHDGKPVYHRDIRQPNILKHANSEDWYIIDFSDATEEPTHAATHLTAECHSPKLFSDGHGAEVDVWGVGHYLSEILKKCYIREEPRIQEIADRWKEDATITAKMALAEIEAAKHLFMDLEDKHAPTTTPAMSKGLQIANSAGIGVGTPNAPRRSLRFQANRAFAEDDMETPRPGRLFNRTAREDTS